MNEAQDKETVESTFTVLQKQVSWNERGASYQISFKRDTIYATVIGVSKELFDNTVIGDVFLLRNITATGEVVNNG